jgi:hypothetical protein
MRKVLMTAAGAALAGALFSMPAQAFWGSWGDGPWYGGPWHGGPWYGGGYPYYGGWGGYPYGHGYGYGYPYHGGWGGPWGYGAPYYGYAAPYAAPAPQTPAESENER